MRATGLISGLSIDVRVVEAGENSGTRVTVRSSLEQDRDLYAVPGELPTKDSWTSNTLIKKDAKLVASWKDVRENLPSQFRLHVQHKAGTESKPEVTASVLSDPVLLPEEAIVLQASRADESLQSDEIL